MDNQNRVYPLIAHNILPIIVGTIGLLLIILGIFQFYKSNINNNSESGLQLETGAEEVKSQVQLIIVDVEGAVIKPGVYKVSSDGRMVDALAASGGLSEDADREYVSKNINLAGKLTDGLKIYVPRAGEQVLSDNSKSNSGSGAVLNINTASQSDLEALPGIGPVTAQKIIEDRPYSSIESLTSDKIVGEKVYSQIKDQISAN